MSRLPFVILLMVWTVLVTIRVQRILQGAPEWQDGLWLGVDLVFLAWNVTRLLRNPKSIRNSSTERES